jgi:hypothetical protein
LGGRDVSAFGERDESAAARACLLGGRDVSAFGGFGFGLRGLMGSGRAGADSRWRGFALGRTVAE